MLLIFVFSGCSENIEVDEGSIYNFENYKCEDVYDIEQINLPFILSKDCVSYKFTYVSDGYQIVGFISIPSSLIENKSLGKCILYNRGGNSKIGLLGDEDTAKLCVATNRIVIASQYRGSDGCEGKDEFGGSDLNDVIKLIDLCESDFSFINMEDFCVAGVSRGGMMTYMTAKQDDRVKRIIAVSAVSDLFQSYDEREDMHKVLYNCIGGSPQDMPDEYKKRSALYWSKDINIPTLIIHSKYDKQVSFKQAENLYDKLSITNQEVSLVVREDNVHGLSDEDTQAILEFLSQNI